MFNADNFHGLKLLTHCGGGAYGDVYYCEDISGKRMAVKIISKKRLGDSWERELRGVINYRKITENAPELLQIFHVEEDEETFFYTMEAADSASEEEYVPDTLAYRLRSGALPQDDLMRVLSGVFSGIKLIHEAGFTHRDIKPDNILFVKGVPRLADIGLMSSLSATMTHLAGTLEFIPPEERTAEYSGASGSVSRQRNDLYAFGKVIYCAATGKRPNEYPATPADMQLSLPLKYFLRLSFELCNKEPIRRLNTIERLEQEIKDIERKLLYGETFQDKLKGVLKHFSEKTVTPILLYWGLLRKHSRFMFLLFFLGVLTSLALFLLLDDSNEKSNFPATVKLETQQYINKEHKISMTIPLDWEIVPKEEMLSLMKKAYGSGKDDKFTRKQFNAILEGLKQAQDFIYCDFDKECADNIVIEVHPFSAEDFRNMSAEKFGAYLQTFYEKNLGFKTEIFAFKKETDAVHGNLTFFADYSIKSGTRANGYWYALKDKVVVITLTAKDKTFEQRQKEFNSVLKTLKIEK